MTDAYKGIRCILLAAGLGTRLQPLTNLVPKCLMPVNGRPLLEYWLYALHRTGIDPVLVNLHHHAEMVRGWLASRKFPNTVQIFYEEELLGTGGTLLANRDFCNDGPVLVVHADNLCGADLGRFISAHRSRPTGTEITMMTFSSPDPCSCGIVELDHRGVVMGFHEKVAHPPGNLANAALYIVESGVLNFLRDTGQRRIDFSTEVLPHYLGRIATFHNDVFHCDIGTPESLLRAQYRFKGASPARQRADQTDSDFILPAPELTRALAESLGAKMIDIDDEEAVIKASHIPGSSQRIVLQASKGYEPERAAANIALHFAGRLDRIFVCFPAVTTDFHANKIFDRYGVRTLALNTVDRQ